MNYIILLIALPLLLSFLSMVFKSLRRQFLALGALINVLLLFTVEKGTYMIGGFSAPYGISLVIDQWSYIGIVLVNVLFLFTLIANERNISDHSPVLLTLIAGVNGMILTGDLFNLFVFMEITTISLYVLSTQSKKYIHTLNYLILGSVGSGLYLLGVILLYGSFGSLNMADISTKAGTQTTTLVLPFLLMFVGLSVETKLFPFNGWVKGIYKSANGLIASVLASVSASAGLLVMGRIVTTIFASSGMIMNLILLLACLTLISGEFSAFKGKSIKEILLYSSIGQSGLVTLLLVSGMSFPASLVLINNAISKLIMFSTADELSSIDSDYMNLKGVFLGRKWMGLAFTTASLSLIGLPLFLGFYAKLNALIGLFSVNLLLPAVILGVTIIEGAYLIRLNIALWHPGNEGESLYDLVPTEVKSSRGLIAVVTVLSLVILLAGIRPDLIGSRVLGDDIRNGFETVYMFDLKGGQ